MKLHEGLKPDVVLPFSQNSIAVLEQSVHPSGGDSVCYQKQNPSACNEEAHYLGLLRSLPGGQRFSSIKPPVYPGGWSQQSPHCGLQILDCLKEKKVSQNESVTILLKGDTIQEERADD